MPTIFCLHQSGHEIVLLQRALNEILNVELFITGQLDHFTQSALEEYQFKNKINEKDRYGCVYGSQTQWAIESYIEDRFITDQAHRQAADLLGVDTATIRTLIDVLSTGRGYVERGQLLTRYERQLFYSALVAKDQRELADSLTMMHPELCNPRAGHYVGGIKEIQRLNTARTYCEQAALSSASYGMFQLSGAKHAACGYTDVVSFHESMAASEKNQLLAFCELLKHNLDAHATLKKRDWEGFARRYYGGSYTGGNFGARLGNTYLAHRQTREYQ